MWFTEFAANKIGRISGTGAITEFTVPTANAGPYQIAYGAGGAMWFTEYNTTKIGRISGDGTIREFPIPAPSYGAGAITGSGPGPVFAADPAGFVDVVSPQGAMTRIKVPPAAGLPFGVARLSSGALWLSELTGFYEFSRHLIELPAGQGTRTLPVTLPNPLSNVVALAAEGHAYVEQRDFTVRAHLSHLAGAEVGEPDGSRPGARSTSAPWAGGQGHYVAQGVRQCHR